MPASKLLTNFSGARRGGMLGSSWKAIHLGRPWRSAWMPTMRPRSSPVPLTSRAPSSAEPVAGTTALAQPHEGLADEGLGVALGLRLGVEARLGSGLKLVGVKLGLRLRLGEGAEIDGSGMGLT